MRQKNYLSKVAVLTAILAIGMMCIGCSESKVEDLLPVTIDSQTVQQEKYDSTYNADYNLYVVSDDTIAYNLQNYSTPLNVAEKEINATLNEYAAKMLSEYSDLNRENTILSPLSATMLYSMMSNFSNAEKSSNAYKDNMGLAQAKTENVNSYFRKFINKKNEEAMNSEKGYGLSLSSNLWMEKKSAVYKSFLSTSGFYGVNVKGMDLEKPSTLSYINETIRTQMGSDDTAVKQSALNNAKSLITSSVAFKNEWKDEFRVDSALSNEFKNIDGSKTVCKTLCVISKNRYGHFDQFDMIEVPYKDETYSMFVILPHDNDALSQSLASLYRQGMARCMEFVSDTIRSFRDEHLENRDTIVGGTTYTVVDTLITDTVFDIRLPQVKICSSTPLNPQETNAMPKTRLMYQTNLPKVSPNGFTLGNIFQSCSFELNEKSMMAESESEIEIEIAEPVTGYTSTGSIISTGTIIKEGSTGSGQQILDPLSPPKGKIIYETIVVPFHATHPFAIFIRDNKMGTIPFASSIKNISNQ